MKFLVLFFVFLPLCRIVENISVNSLVRFFLVPHIVLLPAGRLVMRHVVDEPFFVPPLFSDFIADY